MFPDEFISNIQIDAFWPQVLVMDSKIQMYRLPVVDDETTSENEGAKRRAVRRIFDYVQRL